MPTLRRSQSPPQRPYRACFHGHRLAGSAWLLSACPHADPQPPHSPCPLRSLAWPPGLGQGLSRSCPTTPGDSPSEEETLGRHRHPHALAANPPGLALWKERASVNGTGQLCRSLQEARQLFHSTPTTSSAPGPGLLKPHPKAQGLRIELWFLTILTAQSPAQSEGTTVANSRVTENTEQAPARGCCHTTPRGGSDPGLLWGSWP